MQNQNLTGYPSIDKPWLKYYTDEAINSPLPECTIYEYLYENNKDNLERVALNYFDRKITYGQMFDNIDNAAKAFTALGVNKGDIVTIISVTTPETIYAFYGLNRIGAISNMVDPRTSTEGIKEYIEEVNSKLVITIEVALPKIEKAIIGTNVEKIISVSPYNSLPAIKKFIVNTVDKIKGTKKNLPKNCMTWNEFVNNSAKTQYVTYKKDNCCVIVHTGGTTGSPKGVMLSDYSVNCAAFQAIVSGIDFKRWHTWLNIMPPFIAYGIGNGLHLPLCCGMEVILIPQFDPAKFDELLIKHKPNHMVGVPSHYGNIINSKKMRNADLSYIIAPTVGGDKMDEALEVQTNEFLRSHNCEYKVTKGYGMTEVNAGVALCTSNKTNELGSVGIPFPQTIIAIFDMETGEELKYGEKGEVCITGPNTMLGYYNNQEETDKILKVHSDGLVWVHSGDLGYINENGSLFIEGRVKRMIVRHDGFKVFPPQIEKVIANHNAVISCCVVGVDDKSHSQGRLPIAFIVAQENIIQQQVKNELFTFCKTELPEYAQPIDFIFKDNLPLTSIGKVDYRKLEMMACE